jgi:predicted nucleotidyltransferase
MGTIQSGLGDALFAGVQQRVLGALFGNPERSYYGNELLRLTGSGKGALQRELDRLVKAGLVTVRSVGNQKHYQANPEAPIFEELRGIAVKTFGVGDAVRGALLPLAKKIRAAFIYGSVAKRADTTRSDIDLLVVSDALGYQDLIRALQPAERRLGRKISPTLYSAAELAKKRSGKSSFVTRILQQPKIFLIGSDRDFE